MKFGFFFEVAAEKFAFNIFVAFHCCQNEVVETMTDKQTTKRSLKKP